MKQEPETGALARPTTTAPAAPARDLTSSLGRIPWDHVLSLARQVEHEAALHGRADPEMALRLARAVLHFQEQLLGTRARPR